MMRVRCVTINLKGLEHAWFDARCPVLIQGLKEVEPDLIAFQETTIRQTNTIYNQARVIGTTLGLNHCVFTPYGNPDELISHEHGGIALVSRWPISDARIRKLPHGYHGAYDSRVAIQAVNKRLKDAYLTMRPNMKPNDPGYTWSSTNPLTKGWNLADRRIDYIYCDHDAAVKSCQLVLDRPNPVFASDHFGVFADLEWSD